jgi:hypothetical protein
LASLRQNRYHLPTGSVLSWREQHRPSSALAGADAQHPRWRPHESHHTLPSITSPATAITRLTTNVLSLRMTTMSRNFGLDPYKGVDLYPLYALELKNGSKPLPIMKEVLQVLADKDNWQKAFWFGSVNHGPAQFLARRIGDRQLVAPRLPSAAYRQHSPQPVLARIWS